MILVSGIPNLSLFYPFRDERHRAYRADEGSMVMGNGARGRIYLRAGSVSDR